MIHLLNSQTILNNTKILARFNKNLIVILWLKIKFQIGKLEMIKTLMKLLLKLYLKHL
jgi:hypothetical protein